MGTRISRQESLYQYHQEQESSLNQSCESNSVVDGRDAGSHCTSAESDPQKPPSQGLACLETSEAWRDAIYHRIQSRLAHRHPAPICLGLCYPCLQACLRHAIASVFYLELDQEVERDHAIVDSSGERAADH
jgi:hypothetical protein